MLMECLAAGRSISLPSSNTGMAKLAVRAVGGYARVRSQFKTAIGRFEGIEEPLARMGGNLYMMDAARTLTAGAIDLGEKPSVVSAIAKYHITEARAAGDQRRHGHPRRQGHLPRPQQLPRPRLPADPGRHHGRGRQHPDAQPHHLRPGRDPLPSLRAARDARARGGPTERASIEFDDAPLRPPRFTCERARTLVIGLTGSHFAAVPVDVAPETRRYYQQLTRFSAALRLPCRRVDARWAAR
jgi:acyl-CoA dehydrogenase